MKSKRFLTMLLSLAIMLTFMPTMAFAAQEGTASEGHKFDILTDESNVEWKIAPTCTKPGYGVVTCQLKHGGVQCKATKNVKKAALGHQHANGNDYITVTAAEYAAQIVKEGLATEAQAKTWLDTVGKEICTGRVYPCTHCGLYYIYSMGGQHERPGFKVGDLYNFYSAYKTTEHVAPEGTKDCAATFDCFVCSQKGVSNSKYNASESAAYHGFDDEGNWTLNNNFKVKKDKYIVHSLGEATDGKNVYATVYECKECGLEMRTHEVEGAAIEAFEHKNTYTVTTEPTCTDAGFTATFCADCGYRIKGEGTEALGHKFEEVTLAPATESHGKIVGKKCIRCPETKDEEVVSLPIKHNITSTVIAPNSCSDCTWILVECTNPDCIAEEQAVFITKKEDVNKVGSEYYFTFDGEKVEVPFVDATGHNWGDKQTIHEATCTEGAEEGRTCTVCGAINHNSVREISKPLGHDVEEVVVAPTCGEAGYSYKICNRCTNYLTQAGAVKGKTPADLEAVKYAPTNPVVKLGAKCQYEWQTLEEATPFKLGTRAKVCTVCNNELAATKESIAKTKIAAPKVKALKKKAKVSFKAVEGATKYQILVNGKVVKKNAKAGKTYTIKKKNLKLGKKNKFQVVAINAAGEKATSAAKSVKIKKK